MTWPNLQSHKWQSWSLKSSQTPNLTTMLWCLQSLTKQLLPRCQFSRSLNFLRRFSIYSFISLILKEILYRRETSGKLQETLSKAHIFILINTPDVLNPFYWTIIYSAFLKLFCNEEINVFQIHVYVQLHYTYYFPLTEQSHYLSKRSCITFLETNLKIHTKAHRNAFIQPSYKISLQ